MQRFGRSHRPFYRIAAMESREKRNGKVLENLGYYNPFEKDEDKQVQLEAERIKDWLGRGAQPTDTVRDMLAKAALLSDAQMKGWEADRERERNRTACKAALSRAEAAVKAIEEMSGSADTDPAPYTEAATAAAAKAKKAVSPADIAAAESAAAEAEAQVEAMKKAEEELKAKQAAEEAASAAAEAEASAESEGDAADGETEEAKDEG